jgi:hypothetical protein
MNIVDVEWFSVDEADSLAGDNGRPGWMPSREAMKGACTLCRVCDSSGFLTKDDMNLSISV